MGPRPRRRDVGSKARNTRRAGAPAGEPVTARRVRLHPEVLGARQRRALAVLGRALSPRGFYLGGGTATALFLGHRRSVDLDWFREDAIDDPLRLAAEIREIDGRFRASQVAPGTLHGTVGGVRVSFLEYRYPLLERPFASRTLGVRLASPDDLATMKVAAAVQRGAKKDFIDLFALASRHRPLAEMIELYVKRFAIRDVGHALYGLSFFEQADRERSPRMLWRVRWPAVKAAFERWVREIAAARATR